MVQRVNQQIAAFQQQATELVGTARRSAVEDFIDLDKSRVSWTRALKDRVARNQPVTYDPDHLVVGSYRPFCRQILYFDRALNETVSQQPRIFPSAGAANLGFTLTGPSSHYEFGVLATTSVPDLHLLDTGQYFPRYRYTDPDDGAGSLFEASGPERVDNINADTLAAFSKALGRDVSADDVFFYTYGLLHSPDYRSRYRADLKRQLPRIPIVTAFDHFVEAGRKLVDLHVGYEGVEPYPLGDPSLDTLIEDPSRLRVEKMAYAKKGREKDRTSIVYNRHITLTGIPEEAHRYLLGPKSAVEWVMERYQVKTDRPSGIVNDPNAWCDEVGDPRYIIDLVKRVVTVSVETMAIVDALPPLDIIS
jgi:predicted helicase